MFHFTRVMLVALSCALLWTATATQGHAGLIGLWNLDDNLNDTSGGGHTGTASGGPTYVAGKFGKAMSFDGIDDKVQILDDAVWDTGDAVSVSHWFKTDAASDRDRMVTHDSSGYKYQTYLNNDDNVIFFVDTGGSQHAKDSVNTYRDGAWHHIVGVYDRSDSLKRVKLYMDGSLVASSAGVDAALSEGDDGITFAYYPGYYYTGLFDDVAIFDHAMSAGDVAYLWNDGTGRAVIPEPGTLALLAAAGLCLALWRARRTV